MKHLPRQKLHRIYNPIDSRTVNKEESNPEMLENGLDTYDVFTWFVPSSNLVDDGIEYNIARLDIPSAIPDIGLDQYKNSELYLLQNPDFETDYAKTNSIYPSSARYMLIRRMLQNYNMLPRYNVSLFTGLSGGSAIPVSGIPFDPNTDYASTISVDDWIDMANEAYDTFKESLTDNEGSSAISGKYDVDSYSKKLYADIIRCNSGDAVPTKFKTENDETVVYSETLEEFEAEYQAFIEALRKKKL